MKRGWLFDWLDSGPCYWEWQPWALAGCAHRAEPLTFYRRSRQERRA